MTNIADWTLCQKHFILPAKVITHFAQNEIIQDTLCFKVWKHMFLCLIFFQEQNDNYNKVQCANNCVHMNLFPNFYLIVKPFIKKEIDLVIHFCG